MITKSVDPLHPSTESKVYTVHLSDAFVLGAAVTAATWAVTDLVGAASTLVTVDSSSYVNVGDAGHTAIETRDGVDYDGPLLSVVVTAADGSQNDCESQHRNGRSGGAHAAGSAGRRGQGAAPTAGHATLQF